MRITFVFVFLFGVYLCFGQNQSESQFSSFDINYFSGNIALHNDDILHLIQGHPEGIIISWNRKTFGKQAWEQRYNYPDYGLSFSYQNLKYDVLGQNYAIYGHYNFYFFNRNLMLRIGQGLALTTNPYDKNTNFKNNASAIKSEFESALLETESYEVLVGRGNTLEAIKQRVGLARSILRKWIP